VRLARLLVNRVDAPIPQQTSLSLPRMQPSPLPASLTLGAQLFVRGATLLIAKQMGTVAAKGHDGRFFARLRF
jgi:hypothetical protein